jgi:hypothetical protein
LNPIRAQYQLAAAVSNGLVQSQSLPGAGNLTLNGSLVSGGVGTLDSGGAARRVLISSVGNDAGISWTLTGTDRYSNPQTETVAGGNATPVYSALDYLTITRIAGSGATAGNVTAGTNGVGSTPWFPREFMSLGSLGVLIWVASGKTVGANFELTWDDFNVLTSKPPYGSSVEPSSDYPPKPVVATGFSGVTATTYNEVSVPHYGFRMTIISGTDPAILQVIESAEVNGGGY